MTTRNGGGVIWTAVSFETIIVSRVPVVRCSTHGTQTVAVPWAEKYARFTRLFERFAIDVMRECSISGACDILKVSWDEADGIKQRAVKRGLARKEPKVMKRLCVDEKGMGHGHNYLTIVANVSGDRTTVEYVGEEREQESLDAFWKGLTAEQLAGVEAVGMDMWEPYVRSTLAHVPGAATKIVHDPFHLVKHMNEAVNEVRVREHKRLLAAGDETLKNTRQLWLYGMENVPSKHTQRFDEVKELNLQTSRAWAIKEVFRSFWLCDTVKKAERYFDQWYGWAIRSRRSARANCSSARATCRRSRTIPRRADCCTACCAMLARIVSSPRSRSSGPYWRRSYEGAASRVVEMRGRARIAGQPRLGRSGEARQGGCRLLRLLHQAGLYPAAVTAGDARANPGQCRQDLCRWQAGPGR